MNNGAKWRPLEGVEEGYRRVQNGPRNPGMTSSVWPGVWSIHREQQEDVRQSGRRSELLQWCDHV